MRVVTSYPVRVRSRRVFQERNSNITGSDKKEAILAFQKFANKKDASLKLSENGVWDEATNSAALKYGAEFDKVAKMMFGIAMSTMGIPVPQTTTTTSETPTTPGTPTTPTTPTPAKDEKKKMSTGVKIALIAGGVLLVGGIVLLIVKSKKK